MTDADNIVEVKILDRQYRVKCPSEKVQELQDAARHVDEQMRKLRQGGNAMSMDRLAVIAALNICHEFLNLQKQKNNCIDLMFERIQGLHDRVENALANNENTAV